MEPITRGRGRHTLVDDTKREQTPADASSSTLVKQSSPIARRRSLDRLCDTRCFFDVRLRRRCGVTSAPVAASPRSYSHRGQPVRGHGVRFRTPLASLQPPSASRRRHAPSSGRYARESNAPRSQTTTAGRRRAAACRRAPFSSVSLSSTSHASHSSSRCSPHSSACEGNQEVCVCVCVRC